MNTTIPIYKTRNILNTFIVINDIIIMNFMYSTPSLFMDTCSKKAVYLAQIA